MHRDNEALLEIEKAPIDAEMGKHWALVLDAKFFRLYLLAKNNHPIGADQLNELPGDYVYIMPKGELFSKDDLNRLATRE